MTDGEGMLLSAALVERVIRGDARHIVAAACRSWRAPPGTSYLLGAVSVLQRVLSWWGWAGACVVSTATCAQSGGELVLPDVAAERFALDAYPVLLRDCAMASCHGDPDRFLRIVGPGRVRLSADTPPLDPATPDEVTLSFRRAQSLLADGTDRAHSLLLRKPLELGAGGAVHAGQDAFGRNVYKTADAPGYRALQRWALEESP